MNDFYKALETKRESDISHYGVRGMHWGVRIDYDDKKDDQGRIISSKPTAKDLDDAFTESIVDSANIYMCSKVIAEAEKRAAKKGGKK